MAEGDAGKSAMPDLHFSLFRPIKEPHPHDIDSIFSSSPTKGRRQKLEGGQDTNPSRRGRVTRIVEATIETGPYSSRFRPPVDFYKTDSQILGKAATPRSRFPPGGMSLI